MNNLIDAVVLVSLLCFAAGIFASKSFDSIKSWIDFRRNMKKFANLEKITENNVCTDGHTWDKLKVVMRQLPVDMYNTCTKCGFVSGTEFVLNSPALGIYKNQIEKRELRLKTSRKIYSLRQAKLDQSFNRLSKDLIQRFGNDLQNNVEVLKLFFWKSIHENDVILSELEKELENENG